MSFLVFDIRFASGKMNVGFDGQYDYNSQDSHNGRNSFYSGLRNKVY